VVCFKYKGALCTLNQYKCNQGCLSRHQHNPTKFQCVDYPLIKAEFIWMSCM